MLSDSQNAFVDGRQILDATLIVDEAIDLRKRRSEVGLACKLNFGKNNIKVISKVLCNSWNAFVEGR